MGCGCGGKTPPPMMPAISQGGRDMYMLGAFPTCTENYHGPYDGSAVFVVAPATPNEKLFRWVDYVPATAYAESLGLSQIDNVPVSALCQQAVEALYAGT